METSDCRRASFLTFYFDRKLGDFSECVVAGRSNSNKVYRTEDLKLRRRVVTYEKFNV